MSKNKKNNSLTLNISAIDNGILLTRNVMDVNGYTDYAKTRTLAFTKVDDVIEFLSTALREDFETMTKKAVVEPVAAAA